MKGPERLVILCVVLGLAALAVDAQEYNFPDRETFNLHVCPYVEITKVNFGNTVEGRSYSSKNRFEYEWRNIGNQPVIAFEIVTLKYDPFNKPMTGSRLVVTGHNSADYTPLKPGENSRDGVSDYGHSDVFTAVVYVRAVRLADGTVWRANEAEVLRLLRENAPYLTDIGPLLPEKKEPKEKK